MTNIKKKSHLKDFSYLLSRNKSIFSSDITSNEFFLCDEIQNNNFLVIGGAGTIGQSIVLELFKRKPKKLHVVDINENNLTELVRDIRSSLGYIDGEFKTFCIDAGSCEFEALINQEKGYDYVFNLSALKHVRSEKDPFTLMRMIQVNIINTIKTIKILKNFHIKKYFSVSTDKATNPINLMGGSKRIMELCLLNYSDEINISTARFANVAFSDGSILHSIKNRIEKKQPISIPSDITRYFISPLESGQLCVLSAFLGENRDVFFPKFTSDNLINIKDILVFFLRNNNFEPVFCNEEDKARTLIKTLPNQNKWPVLLTKSDTTGEKLYEEFYTTSEIINSTRFKKISIIKNTHFKDDYIINNFLKGVEILQKNKNWTKTELISLFQSTIKDFNYEDKGKYLDSKM